MLSVAGSYDYEHAVRPRWREKGLPGMTIAERERYLDEHIEHWRRRAMRAEAGLRVLSEHIIENAVTVDERYEQTSAMAREDRWPYMYGTAYAYCRINAERAARQLVALDEIDS